jgi:hypothetical protein
MLYVTLPFLSTSLYSVWLTSGFTYKLNQESSSSKFLVEPVAYSEARSNRIEILIQLFYSNNFAL